MMGRIHFDEKGINWGHFPIFSIVKVLILSAQGNILGNQLVQRFRECVMGSVVSFAFVTPASCRLCLCRRDVGDTTSFSPSFNQVILYFKMV